MVFDFDGTLCLGDDPVLAYAAQIDERLPARRRIPRTVAQALDDGDLRVPGSGAPASALGTPQDGYQLVQRLGRAAGLSPEQCGEAFRAARRELLDRGLAATDVHAPPGAGELLARLRAHVAVVLITNAPAAGFAPWLEALGLTDSFDAVINDAAKPDGMPAALAEARRRTGLPGDAPTASLGDIWANDLAPFAESATATTVLIDHFGTGEGDPTHRVRTFAEAAAVLEQWAGL